MENLISNKKLKENQSENNDNHKIIVLPLIIQKSILYLLYEEISNLKRENDHIKTIEIKNYSLVNWNWFKNSQVVFQYFFPSFYRGHNYDYHKYKYHIWAKHRMIDSNSNNNNNKFKLINCTINTIKAISIEYFDINNESINFINTLKSLETINVESPYDNYDLFNDSIWVLTYLNRLINKDIQVNFKLNFESFDSCERDELEVIEKEELIFKTNQFIAKYDFQHEVSYGFVYEMIKELKPKSLKIKPFRTSDSASHLQQYHSISKLNQNYESVEIISDFIPLYAFYRFLQAPKLHTLKFDLQFHFLSKIYDNNFLENGSEYNTDIIEFDFNKMDNFKFEDFGEDENITFEVKNKQFYIDNGINEDNQIFCQYSNQYDYSCTSIPPYSMSLWKECLHLLSTNSTITNLSISNNCGEGCEFDENSFLYNENFLNDFMNSLANNKTIKTLTLYFNPHWSNSKLFRKSISLMLDQNSTLETIFVDGDYSNMYNFPISTKNTKCKVITREY
ncbi:hypothetical protein ACTA71_007669 [Dictyostelium dimigraforme]